MCVTLSSKVNRQNHLIVFDIFDILDLENVRIDTKINFVSCLQPEIRNVMQKGLWPWFSRSFNKDRIFSLSPLDSLTPKTYPWEIYFLNSDGKAKIQGGGTHPPPLGRPKVDFYLGHLRVKMNIQWWRNRRFNFETLKLSLQYINIYINTLIYIFIAKMSVLDWANASQSLKKLKRVNSKDKPRQNQLWKSKNACAN